METLFRVSNLLVLPFWAMMILVPSWRWTRRVLRSLLVSAAPGWSTVGGHVRGAHLVGLHGPQLLPIVGWLLNRPKWAARLRMGHRLSLVRTVGVAYLAVVVLLAWPALCGQSVIHPDEKTTAVAVVILSVAVILLLTTITQVFSAERASRHTESRPVGQPKVTTLSAAVEEKP